MKVINIFCSNQDEVKNIAEKIKNNNYGLTMIIDYNRIYEFRNDKIRIKVKVPEYIIGDRYNICLFTDTVDLRSEIAQWCMGYLQTRTFTIDDTSYDNIGYSFMGNANLLDKIIRDDLSYVLINNYEDGYNIEFVTNNLAEALYQIEENNIDEIHMFKNGLEINKWNIGKKLNNDILNDIAKFKVIDNRKKFSLN